MIDVKVGIPREVKNNEFRVAITPAGVHELVRHGHQVVIERNAGVGSSITDAEYVSAGAQILDTADEVWATADLLLKVKEPIAEEYHRLRKDQTLFTYLHLAASRECTDALLESGTTAIAYETVETASRALPLLAPMSEVAGRLAPQVGAYHLMAANGGRGVLPGGVPGVARRQGRRHRRRRLRLERHADRHRHGLPRDPARQGHQQAQGGRQDLRHEDPDRRLQRLRAGEGRASRPTSSSAPSSSRAPRRRSWSPTSSSPG